MTDTAFIVDLIVAGLLLVGAILTLVGSFGLLKLSDPVSRLHAPTVASTLGVGTLLLASMFDGFASGAPSLHEMLVMAFLFVTAPISAHFMAKVHLHRCGDLGDVPEPPNDRVWATRTDP
ncbi:Na+/H+ antiporter subunit G [Loktanella sp. DJP18]|uniref:Na+/H+ antiporter subunit G n=1 Tax=Loktanella sp. DJP18 TaxID=3409788 RepID=UPI003BB49BC9